MKSVYHFILDHRVGGPHIYVQTIRKVLSDDLKSIIVTTNRGPLTDIALLNLRHLWAPLYILEIFVNFLLLVGLVITGQISRTKTIFNIHGSANIAPVLVARIMGIPVVWHIHETTLKFKFIVKFGSWVIKRHPHKFAVVAKNIFKYYKNLDAVLIPSAVDTDFWLKISATKEQITKCSWKNNKNIFNIKPLKILCVANLNPLKGIDILLEAIKQINISCQVKIVGSELKTHKKYADKLYLLAQEINTNNNLGITIEFLGWMDKYQIRTLMASCDCFVLTSRSEACPIALLEAVAMGCPRIATNVGDVDWIMKNSVHSLVVDSISAESVGDAIIQMSRSLTEIDINLAPLAIDFQLKNFQSKMIEMYSNLVNWK